jgi:type IV pilus assembly protein PilN
MRLPLNLASQPMRRDRPILVASAAVAILLCVSLVALIGLAITDRHNMDETRASISRVQAQLNKTNAAQAQIDAQMRLPENATVLYRNLMFNQLIERKAISWTRIFADLEKVLPHNVRIASIRPTLNGRNQLSLEMVVAADTAEPVIGFIGSLEQSDVFGDVSQTSWIEPTQNDPFVRFHVTVIYGQKL